MNIKSAARIAAACVLTWGLAALPAGATGTGADDATAKAEISALYRKLIDAENAHDIAAVKQTVWQSPNALFVAKTKTPEEGNWAGFWGADIVVDHINDLFQSGTFVMTPDYSRLRVVRLSRDVMQSYVPLQISVAYAGQSGTPKSFLMIVEWVKDRDQWRMASDIAVPVPPPPASGQ
ncbi:MAG TPA: hypothetical protein VH206_21675 [Xanthobacteraceae bacterium]|jgi:hypothetical protein|nr:hypothetical protein [Xanthobacteraceae bacterium]